MMKRINFPVLGLAVVSMFGLAVIYFCALQIATNLDREKETIEGKEYGISVFSSPAGWGYNITSEGKLLIHQPYIPGIKGEQGFPDESSAKACARLVVQKLLEGKKPGVQPQDLVQWGIPID
ncbi:DUF4907 domain-containing protein [Rapidithrix thailandica]|uniref:DUF4907 domain-containing protein n=1 Tax=Rapidithrix thailandica TaxID=413964 RepID=A0AAW9S4D3_9BACT